MLFNASVNNYGHVEMVNMTIKLTYPYFSWAGLDLSG